MKHQISVFTILVCFLLALVFPTTTIGQSKEDLNKEKKLQRIDREIEEASSDKTAGITKLVVGVGVSALAFAFTPTSELTYNSSTRSYGTDEKGNAGLFYGCLAVGSVLQIWGVYQWWDAANTMSMLRTKRYDISFKPIILPDKNGKLNPGLSVQMNF